MNKALAKSRRISGPATAKTHHHPPRFDASWDGALDADLLRNWTPGGARRITCPLVKPISTTIRCSRSRSRRSTREAAPGQPAPVSNSFRSTQVRALPGGMMADENLVAYCAPMAPQELFAVLTELNPSLQFLMTVEKLSRKCIMTDAEDAGSLSCRTLDFSTVFALFLMG